MLTDWSRRLLAAPAVDHVAGRARGGAGEQVLRRPGRYLDAAAAGPDGPVDRRHHGRPRRRRVRDDELARPARRAWLGVPDRYRVGLGRRARPAARVAGREGRRPVGRARPLRPGDRPVQPVADHPRVGGTRHRVRPGHRVRGGVRGHQLRHAGPARHPALRLAAHARHRRPHGPARAGDGRLRRRRGRDRRVGPGARRRSWSATSSTARSPHASASTAATAAPSPTPRTRCRCSGWRTCRCSRTGRPTARRTT